MFEQKRKNLVFLSSSYVNIAKLFAQNNRDYDVFLILDRKFPFNIEDEELDNFYSFVFDKQKLFDRNSEKYFDNLAVFVNEYHPEFIIASNYSKLIPKSFIEFMKFRNSKIQILNIHHGDLRILDENKDMRFKGLNADRKEMIDEGMIITTIHRIEDERMDEGQVLDYSHETSLRELKQKGFMHKTEEILNYRIRNVVLSYHERTKVLKLLTRILLKL